MTNIIKKLVKDLDENEGITLGNDVLPYVEKAIHQALAEERERVRGIAKRTIGINTTTMFDEVVYKNGIDVKEYINKYDFLSSLDITKEDI